MARPIWSDAKDAQGVQRILADNQAKPHRWSVSPMRGDRQLLRAGAYLQARGLVQQSHGEGDRIIAQEVRALDDLVKSANLMMERLREWYALHGPDAARARDPKQFAIAVAANPDRAMVDEALGLAQEIQSGADLAPEDLATVQSFAIALEAIYKAWDDIERRIAASIMEVAPNLAIAVGAVLAAKLIAQAGNLERLAGFPSGTVQLLGAETALFRHLKEGTLPPKHGILFQHPHIHQAPAWHRGPLARKLANIASLAAKADAHSKRDMKSEINILWEEARAKVAMKPKPQPKPYGSQNRGPSRGPPRDSRGPSRGPPRDSRGHSRGSPRDSRGPSRGAESNRGRNDRDDRSNRAPSPGGNQPYRRKKNPFDDNKPAGVPGGRK